MVLAGLLSSAVGGLLLASSAVQADAGQPASIAVTDVVANTDGTVSVTVAGTWSWSGCHYATGWSMAWGDAADPGYMLYTGNSTPTAVGVGSDVAVNGNVIDDLVHTYAEDLFTGTVTGGSTSVTHVPSSLIGELVVGEVVVGANVAVSGSGTKITAIDTTTDAITLSAAATSTGSGNPAVNEGLAADSASGSPHLYTSYETFSGLVSPPMQSFSGTFASAGACPSGGATNTGPWGPETHTYPSVADLPNAICVNIDDVHDSIKNKPADYLATTNSDNSIHNTTDSSTWPPAGACTKPVALATSPTSPSVLTGSSISDAATLTGAGTTAPSGTVSFWVCGPGAGPVACTPDAADATALLPVKTLPTVSGTDVNTVTSPGFSPTIRGTYCFLALYSGDGTYSAAADDATTATSSSPSECFTAKAPPAFSVTKSEPDPGNGATVAPGATITYDLNAANASADNASGAVTVTDAIPAGATYVSGSASCGGAANCTPSTTGSSAVTGVTFSFSAPGVATNSSAVLSFKVTVDAADANATVISNAASFTNVSGNCGSSADVCSSNTVTNTVVTPAALSVVKIDSVPGDGATVAPGATITYRLDVENTGGTATGAVSVTDALPAGTAYIDGSASCGALSNCTASTTGTNPVTGVTFSFTAPGIPALGSGSLSFVVLVQTQDANATVIANTAQFTNVNGGCGTDSTCATNRVTNTVVTPPSLSVVKVDKQPGNGATLAPGATITYGLSISNSGGTDTGPVTVTDPVPSGTTYVTGSASCNGAANCAASTNGSSPVTSVTFNFTGSGVPALSSGSLSFQVGVGSGDSDGTVITNTASFTNVNSGCGDAATCSTNSVTNTVTTPPTLIATSTAVATPASLNVAKVDATPGDGAKVAPGSTIAYALNLSNTGGSGTGPVTVTDPIPADTAYSANSAVCGSSIAAACTATFDPTGGTGAGVLTFTLTDLAAGATGSVTFDVVVASSAANGVTISNAARFTNVASSCGDAATCSTNTVTNTVVVVAAISAKHKRVAAAPPAKPTPVGAATVVHTGEPWAGSGPLVATLVVVGFGLVALGLAAGRRRRSA